MQQDSAHFLHFQVRSYNVHAILCVCCWFYALMTCLDLFVIYDCLLGSGMLCVSCSLYMPPHTVLGCMSFFSPDVHAGSGVPVVLHAIVSCCKYVCCVSPTSKQNKNIHAREYVCIVCMCVFMYVSYYVCM